MLRILVVLPFYGGSLPIGRYCAAGLLELGCLVEVFEAPAFYPAITALKDLKISSERFDALQNSFLQAISQCILAKADSFAPDLVLCMAQAPMSRMALSRLKKQGIPTAMWFVEDFRLFTYWRAFAPFYDIFAVIQKEPFTAELARLGVEHTLYLPLAAQPGIHHPLELSKAEKKEFSAPLSFMGAGYPNRRRAFARLIRQEHELTRGFKIWGTEWEEEPVLAPFIQRNGARINSEDCARIYNATDININLHSSVLAEDPVSRGDFVNPRTFELAACGAFQVTDRRSLMPELFADDELAVFDSFSGMIDLIRRYKDKPGERAAMAERARQRVLAEHTYAARMQSLLRFAEERLPGFGKRKTVSWPENMPEDMRQSVDALMQELALPPNAGFDDLITAVRGKSDVLSDAEAALLFLDEWKKLYSK